MDTLRELVSDTPVTLRGISGVLGEVLLLGIVLVMAVLLGLFIHSAPPADRSGSPGVDATIIEHNSTVEVRLHSSGSATHVYLLADDEVVHTWNASDDGVPVYVTGLARGDQLTLVAQQPDGDNTSVLDYRVVATDGVFPSVAVQTVADKNWAPTGLVANISYTPDALSTGEVVTFNGSNSTAPDGTIDTFEWDFTNDGTTDATGMTVNHTYTASGDYTVALTVTDNGSTDTATTTVSVSADQTGGTPNNVNTRSGWWTLGRNTQNTGWSNNETPPSSTPTKLWNAHWNGTAIDGLAAKDGLVFVAESGQGDSNAGNIHALYLNNGTEKWNSLGQKNYFTITHTPVVTEELVISHVVKEYQGHGMNTGGYKEEQLSAVYRDNGTEAWYFYTGESAGAESAPKLYNGTIYFGGGNGTVYAHGKTNNSLKWETRISRRALPTPAVSNGSVYIGNGEDTLTKLDAENGTVVWNTTLGGYLTDVTVVNGTVYAVDDAFYTLFAVDADTGAQLWSVSGPRERPAVVNGTVYTSSDSTTYALNASDGSTRWTASVGGTSPTVANGTVYVGGGTSVYALDADTGAREWSWTGLRDEAWTEPVLYGGNIYIGDYNNSVTGLGP